MLNLSGKRSTMTITVSSSARVWSGASDPDQEHGPDSDINSDITCQIDDALAILATVEANFESHRQCLLDWSGPEAVKRRFITQLDRRQARQRDWLVQKLVELHHRKAMLPLAMES